MVRWIGLGDRWISVSVGLPVELAAIDDDTAERSAVTADELGSRMNHDVGAVLDRTDQDRCEGVVDNEDNAMLVRNGRDGFEVGDVRVRIAKVSA